MHFAITYRIPTEHRDAAQKRFKETGGAPPDSGVKMLQRWHAVGGLRGFIVAEASDPVAISKWMQQWTDVATFDVTPIINDEEVQAVLGG